MPVSDVDERPMLGDGDGQIANRDKRDADPYAALCSRLGLQGLHLAAVIAHLPGDPPFRSGNPTPRR